MSMKNILLPILSIGFLLTFLVSCSTSRVSSEHKDLYKTYKTSLKKLKKESFNKKYASSLIEALHEILKVEERSTRELSNSERLKDKEKSLTKYDEMIARCTEVNAYTNDEFDTYISKYHKEKESLSANISTEYYQLGMSNLNLYEESNLKSKAKDAYHDFSKAKKYDPKNVQIETLLSTALKAAQTKYTIEPDYNFQRVHSFSIDRILDDLERESDKFLTIEYNPIGIVDDVDCEIKLEFSPGIVTIRKINRTSTLNIRVRSHGNQNCSVSNRSLNESHREEIVEYSYTGDERAIPSKYKRSHNEEFKFEQAVIEKLVNDLYFGIKRAIL